MLERVDEFRRPRVEIVDILGLQRVLILRVALAAAGAQILDGGEIKAAAGDLGELRPQPRDHLIDADALRQRLERNEHVAGIDLRIAAAAADAGIADDILAPRDRCCTMLIICRSFWLIAWNEML